MIDYSKLFIIHSHVERQVSQRVTVGVLVILERIRAFISIEHQHLCNSARANSNTGDCDWEVDNFYLHLEARYMQIFEVRTTQILVS